MRRGLVIAMGVVGLALLTGLFGLPGGRSQERPATVRPPQRLGAASCSTAGCHGANSVGVGSEYTTWARHDPHARAYETLLGEASRRIVNNLGPALAGPAEAHRNPLCLRCHVGPGNDPVDQHPRFAASDGVSCENCHGPAKHWVEIHHKPGFTAEEKQERGMRDLRSVTGRAGVCVDCHVGTSGMDVNHDLIAAGHPRLSFEFAAYHAALPRHWRDARDYDPEAGGRPDFAVAIWTVGQAVSAKAALDLLAARAKRGPWPEFAEGDCAACHHTPRGGATHGRLPWNRWYTTSLPAAGATDDRLAADLDKLRRLMEDRIVPDRGSVAVVALQAGAQLACQLPTLAAMTHSPASPAKRFRTVLEHASARSWDDAAQTYLTLDAMHRAWPSPPPALRPALRHLVDTLRFEEGHAGPSRFPSSKLEQAYQSLRDALPTK